MDYLWSALGYSGEAEAAQAQEAPPPAGAGEAPETLQQHQGVQEDAPPGDAPEEQLDGAAGEDDAVRAQPV